MIADFGCHPKCLANGAASPTGSELSSRCSDCQASLRACKQSCVKWIPSFLHDQIDGIRIAAPPQQTSHLFWIWIQPLQKCTELPDLAALDASCLSPAAVGVLTLWWRCFDLRTSNGGKVQCGLWIVDGSHEALQSIGKEACPNAMGLWGIGIMSNCKQHWMVLIASEVVSE